MRKLVVFFVAFMCVGLTMNAQQVVFSEDFTSDPNFTSLSPTHAYWDDTNENYYVNTYDNLAAEYWAYSPEFSMINAGKGFEFEADILFENPEFGTYPGIYFYNEEPTDYMTIPWIFEIYNANLASTGNKMSIRDNASPRNNYLTPTISANTWYHVEIKYYGETKKADITVTSNGSTFASFTDVNFEVANFNFFGVGFYDNPDWGHDWSPVRVDNIIIKQIGGYAIKVPASNTTYVEQVIEIPVKTQKLLTSDNIISYQFDCDYDNTKLKYIGTDITGTISSEGTVDVNTNSSTSVAIGYITSTALSGEGELIKLKFKTIDCGTSDIAISNFKFNNIDVTNIENGSVTAECVYGDVDADGEILAYDAALTLQYSVGIDPLPEIDALPWDNWRKTVADVDGVTGITANDAAEILKHSIGKITEFPVENTKKSGKSENADVIVTVENNEIVFKASGELYGLNISTDATGLKQPIVLDNNMISATNITETNYAVGLCTAYAPTEGSAFMRIPFTTKESVTFDLIVNTELKTVTVDLTTGISKIVDNAISIYPVPANDVLTISGLTSKAELSIYSLAGQLIKQQTVDNGNVSISDLSKGVYVVKISNNDNILTTQRIVKQ